MKEYVDRQLILNHKRRMSGFDFTEEFWDEAVLCEDIKNVPAADVREVVHSSWIHRGSYVVCKACGAMPYSPSNFCPKCGAQMDEEAVNG